jgi:hypothetical protein
MSYQKLQSANQTYKLTARGPNKGKFTHSYRGIWSWCKVTSFRLLPTGILMAKPPPKVLCQALTAKRFIRSCGSVNGAHSGGNALKSTILIGRRPSVLETCPYMVHHVRKHFYRQMQLLNEWLKDVRYHSLISSPGSGQSPNLLRLI